MKRTRLPRRSFLKAAVAGAAATTVAATAITAPALSKGIRRWKMITTWPKNFPGLGTGAQRIADAITETSEGQIEVKLYAAGELVPAFEAFDAVREGCASSKLGPADWLPAGVALA